MIENEKECSTARLKLRDKIIKSATNAFRASGIKGITMDDIATSLSISKRTLYEIFSDKETLLRECILNEQAEMAVYFEEVMANSKNVLEVILVGYMTSIERFHHTSKAFFEDIKKYPKVYELMKNFRNKDNESTIAFFKMGVEQGIFRSDINFQIMNLLVHDQLDMLMNSDLCKKYSFIEVYESIMFTYLRGISTDKGAKVLEEFICEYRKNGMLEELKKKF